MLDSSLDNADEEKIERDAEVTNKEAAAIMNSKSQGEQTKLGEYCK